MYIITCGKEATDRFRLCSGVVLYFLKMMNAHSFTKINNLRMRISQEKDKY